MQAYDLRFLLLQPKIEDLRVFATIQVILSIDISLKDFYEWIFERIFPIIRSLKIFAFLFFYKGRKYLIHPRRLYNCKQTYLLLEARSVFPEWTPHFVVFCTIFYFFRDPVYFKLLCVLVSFGFGFADLTVVSVCLNSFSMHCWLVVQCL